MIEKYLETLANNLRRKSINTCSKWALAYRRIGGEPWSFKYRPWLVEMHDCTDQLTAIQKSAQMGVSETAINRCLFKIDIERKSILYLLPTTKPDAYDFSNSRFDPALEESPHIKKMFSDTKNIGLKRSGSVCLYIRGTGSNSGLRSIPVSDIMFDEINEMSDDAVRLAFSRSDGQMGETSNFMLSTPTIPGKGVSLYYQDSTQDIFMFRCPHCGKLTHYTQECLVVIGEIPSDPRVSESYLQCKECKTKLNEQDKPDFLGKGIWVPTFKDKNNRGFTINQFYSMSTNTSPGKLAKYYLESKQDSSFESEWYNSKMGEPFVPQNSSITESMVYACIGTYPSTQQREPNKIITIGVDVGAICHVVVAEWSVTDFNPDEIIKNSFKKILFAGTIDFLESLDKIISTYNADFVCIDALPETRAVTEVANRFKGIVKICFYNGGDKAADISVHAEGEKITLARTLWMDISLGRIKRKAVSFPCDINEDFKKHMVNQYRIFRKDDDGNLRPFWESPNGVDHYTHASLYSDAALKMYSLSHGENSDIQGIF